MADFGILWIPSYLLTVCYYQNAFASCEENESVTTKWNFFFTENCQVTQLAGFEKLHPVVAQTGFVLVWKLRQSYLHAFLRVELVLALKGTQFLVFNWNSSMHNT